MRNGKYRNCVNNKEEKPQIVCVNPVFRQPTELEREHVLKGWQSAFKNKKPSIFLNIFILFMAGIGLIFGCLTITTLFCEFILSLIFALISVGIVAMVITAYKTSKQSSLEYNNLKNGYFVVSDSIATNLELVLSYRESEEGRLYAYVNVLNSNHVLTVKNVEIPVETGKRLYQNNVREFPCLLVSVKDKNELLATPKI